MKAFARIRRVGGFLLLQQLVSLLMAAILLSMLSATFVLQWQAFRQHSQLAWLQQTAVQMQALLQRELGNNGFWAGVQQLTSSPATLTVQGDCQSQADSGSLPRAGQPWLPHLAGTVGGARTPSCLNNALRQSDFIQLKHLAGQPLSAAGLKPNRVYLQQVGLRGHFVRSGDGGLDPQQWYWPYNYELYYVAIQPLDGQQIPVLMRKRLIRNQQGLLVIDTAAVMDGVEMLVIEIGLDRDADGVAEQFVSAEQVPAAIWLQPWQISQIRYFALLRTLLPEQGYRNEQRYQLGQRQYQAPGDAFRRLLISSSVRVQPASAGGF